MASWRRRDIFGSAPPRPPSSLLVSTPAIFLPSLVIPPRYTLNGSAHTCPGVCGAWSASSPLLASVPGSTPAGASWWASPIWASFFLFLLLPFSINFEIFGEIKNAQIRKFHFEKLFRLKFVQFKICSILNFMFKFEKYIQTRIC
jgi:hypothetical protein